MRQLSAVKQQVAVSPVQGVRFQGTSPCVRHSHLALGRLVDRQRHHCLLDLRRHPVPQDRLRAADLHQGRFPAFVVELLEAVEPVPAAAHHLAGLADIAELLGPVQQALLRSNNLLVLGHPQVPFRPTTGRGMPRPVVRNPPAITNLPD